MSLKVVPINVQPLSEAELKPNVTNGQVAKFTLLTNAIYEAAFNVNVLVDEKQEGMVLVGWTKMVLPEACHLLSDGVRLAPSEAVYANLSLSSRFTVLCPYGSTQVTVSFTPLFLRKECFRFASKYYVGDERNLYLNGCVVPRKPWHVVPKQVQIRRFVSWYLCTNTVVYHRVFCEGNDVSRVIDFFKAEMFVPLRVQINEQGKTLLLFECCGKERHFADTAKRCGVSTQFVAKLYEPNSALYQERVLYAQAMIEHEHRQLCHLFRRTMEGYATQ